MKRLSKDAVRRLVRDSLEKTTTFYQEAGIEVWSLPSFTVLDKDPSNPLLTPLAAVPGNSELQRQLRDERTNFNMNTGIPRFYARFGITVSPDVVAEQTALILKKSRDEDQLVEETQTPPTDILVYPRFIRALEKFETSKERELFAEDTMAHEHWHVIEYKRGIPPSCITEGTAEFARITYMEKKYERKRMPVGTRSPSAQDTAERLLQKRRNQTMYAKGYEIVKRHAQTFTDLFIPGKRNTMMRDMEAHLREAHQTFVEENDPEALRQRGKMLRYDFPEYNELDKGVTRGNLLIATRNLGLQATADELGIQNLDALLEWYGKLGYGKKAR